MKKKTVMIAVRLSAREAEQLAAMTDDDNNASDVIRQAIAALFAAKWPA